jgi:hypothetical protein
VFQVVSSPDARIAYRRNWGLPAVVGALSWDVDGTERVVRCEEPGIELRGAPLGPAVPAWVPLRSVQRRADGPVVLPRRFLSLLRLARTSVAIGDGADIVVPGLSALAGRHAGAVLSGVRIVAEPARHPAGLWSSLRAPLGAVEPAMAGAGGGGGRGRGRGRGRAAATTLVGQKWSPKVTAHAVPTTKTDHSMRPSTVALRTGA